MTETFNRAYELSDRWRNADVYHDAEVLESASFAREEGDTLELASTLYRSFDDAPASKAVMLAGANDALRDVVVFAHSHGHRRALTHVATAALPVPVGYRTLWFVLVVAGLMWGILCGVSLAKGTFISPAAAVFGCIAIIVLCLTANQMGKRKH